MSACARYRCGFPSHVLFVPSNAPALDPHHVPVPHGGVHLIVVCLFDDRDAATKNCDSVAGLDPPFLSTPGIPDFAPLDQQVEPDCVIASLAVPKRLGSFFVLDEDVAGVGGQCREPRFGGSHAKGHHVERQY